MNTEYVIVIAEYELTLMNSRRSKMNTWNMTIRIATMAAVLALCGDAPTHTSTTQITSHTEYPTCDSIEQYQM